MTEFLPGLTIGFIQDSVLILISGLACLYCIVLNRRVKGLSNMKTGLGASIVSLTEAIRQTQSAAQDTETTTLQAIHKLQSLMDTAESTITKLEARKIDLDRLESATLKVTQNLQAQTEQTLETLATLEQKTHDLKSKTSDLDRNVDKASKLADLQSLLAKRIQSELPGAIAEVDTVTLRLQKAIKDIQAQKLAQNDLSPLDIEIPEPVTETVEDCAPSVHAVPEVKAPKAGGFAELLALAFGGKPTAPGAPSKPDNSAPKPRDILQIETASVDDETQEPRRRAAS